MPADEIQVNAPAGNGERMEVRVGNKAIGFTTKDLAQVLMILVMGAFGYFMMTFIVTGQERGFGGLAQILEKMSGNQGQTMDRLAANQTAILELIHKDRMEIAVEFGKQNQMLSDQTLALKAAVDLQTNELRRMFDRQRQMLIRLSHNLGREKDQHLPVDVDLDPPNRER